MKATRKVIAGGLLTCMAMVVSSGPAAADADAPAAAGAPQQQGWDHGGGDGDRRDGGEHGGWQHEGWRHDGGRHHGWRHEHRGVAALFRELGLTDAQRATMKSILETARPAMKELRDKLQANGRLLRQTSPDDKNYAQVVAKVSQENGALVSKLITQRSKLYAQCYAQLAPIQKTRLAELLAQRAKWMEQRKEHMQDHMRQHMDGRGPHSGGDMGAPAAPPAP
jgi:Spy/CpxP family protein refolding chaperone